MASLRDIRRKIQLALSISEGSVKNTVGRGPARAGNIFRRTRAACSARASAQQITKGITMVTFLFMLLQISYLHAEDRSGQLDRAEKNIRMLQPNEISVLPKEVAAQLNKLGCRIPQ